MHTSLIVVGPTRRPLSPPSYRGVTGFRDTCAKNKPNPSTEHPSHSSFFKIRDHNERYSRDWIKLGALTRSHNARLGMRSYSFFFFFSSPSLFLLLSRSPGFVPAGIWPPKITRGTVSNFQRYYYFNPHSSARCLRPIHLDIKILLECVHARVKIILWIFSDSLRVFVLEKAMENNGRNGCEPRVSFMLVNKPTNVVLCVDAWLKAVYFFFFLYIGKPTMQPSIRWIILRSIVLEGK